MTSLLKIAVEGDLEKYQRDEITLKKKADLYALKVGSDTFRRRLGAQTGTALGPRMAQTWQARTYPNGGTNPSALVYSRAPNIISAFMADTVILPKKGRYLAIPTNFNRAGGRRGGAARVTPKDMIASGQSFTRPRKNGPGLIWFLTVNKAESQTHWATKTGKQMVGKVRQMAYAGGLVRVGRYGRSTRDILAARAVPMFVLVPNVHLKKRLDPAAEASRISDELPSLLAEGYSFYDGGAA